MWPAKDKLPAKFSKLAATMSGMPPDLNTGVITRGVRKLLLCCRNATRPAPPAAHVVNGTYTSDMLGTVNLYCVTKVRTATAVCGCIGATRNVAKATSASAWSGAVSSDPSVHAMRAQSGHAGVEVIVIDTGDCVAATVAEFAWTGAESMSTLSSSSSSSSSAAAAASGAGGASSPMRALGRFRSGRSGRWELCEWTFSASCAEARGTWCKRGKQGKAWPLVRDDYLKVCWKRDFNTLYQGQRLHFTDRCGSNTIGA